MSYISYSRGKYIATEEVNLGILSNFLSVIRGFQVFTFLKTVNNGNPIFLNYHVDRVLKNAELIKTLAVFLIRGGGYFFEHRKT